MRRAGELIALLGFPIASLVLIVLMLVIISVGG